MKELAPQSKDGAYQRPSYHLNGVIGQGWPVCLLQIHTSRILCPLFEP